MGLFRCEVRLSFNEVVSIKQAAQVTAHAYRRAIFEKNILAEIYTAEIPVLDEFDDLPTSWGIFAKGVYIHKGGKPWPSFEITPEEDVSKHEMNKHYSIIKSFADPSTVSEPEMRRLVDLKVSDLGRILNFHVGKGLSDVLTSLEVKYLN